MPQQIVIAEQLRIAAVLNDERVDELIVAQGRYQIGDVFLGTVENVLPGIDAAFVNIGESEKNGFIHTADLPGEFNRRHGKQPVVKGGDKLLVQIAKAPTGTKGARLSGRVSVPGRFLVFVPHDNRVCISRRITDDAERSRLRAVLEALKPRFTDAEIMITAVVVLTNFSDEAANKLLGGLRPSVYRTKSHQPYFQIGRAHV